MKRIGFVTPWYGERIGGGAEAELRGLVHHLKDAGTELEVLTTCVESFQSDWNTDFHEPGLYEEAGIPVRRFRVRKRNTERFDALNLRLMKGEHLTVKAEEEFFREMVNSPDLYGYIREHGEDYSLFVMIPYMFGTTYSGCQIYPEKTVLNEVWDAFPRLEQSDVRGALGLFLFTGDEVFAPISTLSGGEKGRVALTELMLRKDNVLLLDEPTNHLDMDSREVLENALSDFPGTIISVSHDRYFINRFAEKVWVLDGNEIKEYLGNYDSYVLKVSRDQEPDGSAPQQTRTAMDKEKRRSREEEKKLREQKEALKAAEQAIARAEKEAGEMEAELADPEIWKDPDKAAETTRRYNALKDEIERLYEQYDALESGL